MNKYSIGVIIALVLILGMIGLNVDCENKNGKLVKPFGSISYECVKNK